MRFDRTTRSLTSWLAILALLMAALAPAVSQAVGTQRGPSWLEVCTSFGATLLRAQQPGDDAPATPDAQVFEHCAYCSVHAHTLALPPVAGVEALLLPLSHRTPTAFLAAPGTLHAWVSAQPRAPPFLS